MPGKTVIIITGPTASGKTDLAIRVAEHFDTSIISADSRQCFRELNIGVAKPDAAQLSAVHHYFINSHSVHEEMNAAIFESLAVQYCDEIFSHQNTAVLCGGTGLYIKAFRDGLDEIPPVNESLRKSIALNFEEKGIRWLQESLRSTDSLFFSSGEMMNPQRMMRALEVMQTTGRSIVSYRKQEKKTRPFRILEFATYLPRDQLYLRINQRVDSMIEQGLAEEAAIFFPYRHLNALQTVGYNELFETFDGKLTLDEAIALIKQNTRHYAKRQLTWLNKNANLITLGTADPLKEIIENYGSPKI